MHSPFAIRRRPDWRALSLRLGLFLTLGGGWLAAGRMDIGGWIFAGGLLLLLAGGLETYRGSHD